MRVITCPRPSKAGKLYGVVDAFPGIWSGKVLDVGCRSGAFREALHRYYPKVKYVGLDLCSGADTIADLGKGLPFGCAVFDVVVALDVLEHTDNIHRALEELCWVAGRFVVITLPNLYELKTRMRILLGHPVSGKYGLPVERPRDRHRWFFSFDEARTFITHSAKIGGFSILDEGCLIGPRRAARGVGELAVSRFPNLLSPWYVALLGVRERVLQSRTVSELIVALVRCPVATEYGDWFMRICFPGGARYSQQLDTTSAKKFKALSQLGDLFVIGFSLDLRPRYFVEHAHFYLLPKWSLPVMRYLTMFTVGPWLVLRLIWRHGVRVLIAKSPYEGLAAAWAKVIACWFACHVVLIVESHGDFEESLFLQRRVAIATLYRFLMRAAAGFALRHADLLRAVSTSTQEQLQRWAPGKPVVRFVTWTDIEVFLEAGTHDGVRQPEIVYAGVLIPRKGVHHLIHAFHRIAPDFRAAQLVIIGRDDNPEYAAGLRATVRQLGLDGRVHFLGGVPQGELARWMGRAQVFVLPSYSEGLPRVVFEAMAAGMPVIATRVSGIPDIVQQDMTGFLVPCGDEAALIERLRWVLAHPAEANSLGQRARDFARTFFQPRSTWTTIGGS